ncbi:MAG: HDOD domain-containing protein, partial [Campylobacterota bacterium]|nr:HDOD domain-containing protein [Campylobacterota bacterium]
MQSVEEIVKSIIILSKHNPNFLKEVMPYFEDNYELAYHSLYVAIYAISLASFLNLDDKQLKDIGIAGLLHDIGIKKIDDIIRNKNSKLE